MSAIKTRRLITRLVLIASLIGIAFLMYNVGKEYKILIDNESITVDGKNYEAFEYAKLTIDGREKKIEVYADDRLAETLVGSTHKFVLTVMNEDDEKVISTVERSIKLPSDTARWMISLAAFAGGAENVFVPNPVFSEEEDNTDTDTPPEPETQSTDETEATKTE